jgi:hypothetical protein
VPVLSANWWKSPKQEARRLTSRMLRREPWSGLCLTLDKYLIKFLYQITVIGIAFVL